MTYRDPQKDGKFAPWVNDLNGKSGAYVMRLAGSGKVMYVGESHTDRLDTTIKRHFWQWKDHEGRRHYVISARRIEVGVRVVKRDVAVSVQNRLIQRLKPEFNRQGLGEEEVPF